MTSPQESLRKIYLGDGVYAEFTGFEIILTTENGIEVTNRIVLEDTVYATLLLFVERMNRVSRFP